MAESVSRILRYGNASRHDISQILCYSMKLLMQHRQKSVPACRVTRTKSLLSEDMQGLAADNVLLRIAKHSGPHQASR